MVAVRNFTKFLTPPRLSFNLETMSSNSPSPMEEKPVHPLVLPARGGGGGTLGISGWGCAAGTMEPLTYTRASSAEFCYPILE